MLGMTAISSCYWVNPEKTKRNFSKHGIYDLDMRVYMKELRFTADEDDDLIREWRMDIPKSFVYQHRGVNGKPNYDPIKDKSNQFSVVLFAAIDPENNRVVEQEKIGWPTPGERQVFLRIINGLPSKKLRGVERCLTDRDKAKISREGGLCVPSKTLSCDDVC